MPVAFVLCLLVLPSCGGKAAETIEGNFKTYEKLSDGT